MMDERGDEVMHRDVLEGKLFSAHEEHEIITSQSVFINLGSSLMVE